MKAKWIFQLACIAVLVAATLGSSQPVQAGVKDPPDHPGPYQAGFTFKLLYDTQRTSPNTPEGGRPIPCYIWYPAAPGDATTMPTALYPYNMLGFGDLGVDTSDSYEKYGIDPAYQEVPPSEDGPFPLVIFSPGLGGWAELYYQFGARLASYGFVVVVLINYGDGALGEPVIDDFTYYGWTRIDRELDIKFAITEFLEMNEDPAGLLHGLIHPDQIAVSGHSWGGYAALGVVVPSGDPWFCDDVYEYPCFSVEPDPRIKATLPLDGSSFGLSYEMMTEIKIPHMSLNREWNTIIEEDPGLDPSYFARQHSAIQGHPNYRVDISDAVHMSFSNACGVFVRYFDMGLLDNEWWIDSGYPYLCFISPENMLEVQNLVTMYMVAFLKTALVGDPGYQYLLTPGYALTNQPLVEFFVTEKQNGRPNKPDWPEYFTYFMHQPGSQTAQALKDPPKPKMERDFTIIRK